MLNGTEGRSDIGPLSVEADTSPKTVAFTWSDTIFKYDGKSHVPTVTVTGLIEGDVCDATVVGGDLWNDIAIVSISAQNHREQLKFQAV